MKKNALALVWKCTAELNDRGRTEVRLEVGDAVLFNLAGIHRPLPQPEPWLPFGSPHYARRHLLVTLQGLT